MSRYYGWTDHWYKDAIIYCVDVELFQDGNGDGVGDFAGLTYRLDYLASLGVTCLWLLPFYPSPNRDNGYDISDYYGVDPRYGTLGDFVEFTHHAQQLGIKLIADLVINHTSDQHPWFQAARADPDSPYRDFYVWSKERPENAEKGMIFPGVQEEVWTYDRKAKAYYFHRFFEHQPDLNIASRAVREEIMRIMGFWLQLGLHGFRIDAAPFVIEHRGIEDVEVDDKHVYLEEFQQFARLRAGDVLLLAEAALPPAEQRPYFGDGDRLQMLLDFHTNQHLFLALARGSAQPLRKAFEEIPEIPNPGQWAFFLRNHDELSLELLTEDERQEVFAAFGPEPEMQIYGRGLRRRLAPMLANDLRRQKMLHSLLMSLPGTPILWYGDEIGMGEDLSQEGRQSVRMPMQWSSEVNAGFSDADPTDLVRPVITWGEYGCSRVNVELSENDPDSLLNWIERLHRIRMSHPAIGRGDMQVVACDDDAVFAHKAVAETETILAVHNFSGDGRTVKLDITEQEAEQLVPVFGDSRYEVIADDQCAIQVSGYGYRWFRLPNEPPDRLKRRR